MKISMKYPVALKNFSWQNGKIVMENFALLICLSNGMLLSQMEIELKIDAESSEMYLLVV